MTGASWAFTGITSSPGWRCAGPGSPQWPQAGLAEFTLITRHRGGLPGEEGLLPPQPGYFPEVEASAGLWLWGEASHCRGAARPRDPRWEVSAGRAYSCHMSPPHRITWIACPPTTSEPQQGRLPWGWGQV